MFKNPFGIFIRFSDDIEFRLYLIGKCYLKVGKLMYYAANKFKIMKYLMYEDLQKYIRIPKKIWWVGDQLSALQYYLNKNIKILFDYIDDDYGGRCYALDGLNIEEGYDYIKATMREGNTKQFKFIKEMEEYLFDNT